MSLALANDFSRPNIEIMNDLSRSPNRGMNSLLAQLPPSFTSWCTQHKLYLPQKECKRWSWSKYTTQQIRSFEEISTIEVMSNNDAAMGQSDAREIKIEDLHYLNAKEIKGQKFKIHGKINNINIRRGWYYKSCSMCTFRVDDGRDTFVCAQHGQTTSRLV
ncbi:hypothetical protein PHJA_001620200 [Phtheirospermum japonicum]|uniref:Uncharacterized protein n=1 Tax=Phtheirospermum japonicum TaxID=374723 RepID=A0A830CCL5_9LAMI|nr:hypothetical protein PHJA_001620200 [Phtheirospermum japonicum]